MNATGVKLFRQSICMSCLSQDRKLFPVNENKSLASLLLNVSQGALCWECHFFVRKVAVFRSRAARAQALLARALHYKNVTKINSLSSLMMTPVHLDITLETHDLSQVNIKTEVVKAEFENTFEYSSEDTCSNTVFCDESTQGIGDDNESMLPVLNKKTEAKGDESSCSKAMGDDVTNASLELLNRNSSLITLTNKYEEDILSTEIEIDIDEMHDDIFLPFVNKETEAKGDEEACGKAISDDIANASLKSLLSRKSTIIGSSHLSNKLINNRSSEDSVILENKDTELVENIGSDDPEATDDASEDNFTVVILDEEEMLEWRERKRNMAVYTTAATGLRCEQCIQPFWSVIVYKAHARRHEEVYGDLACRICGVRSLSESALSIHTANHYRLLQCNVCAHEWDWPNAMREHCYDAHGIPATVWECDQCDKKYTAAVQLRRHVVKHRVAACPTCGARVEQTLLGLHMRIHTSVKVACAVCGKECPDYKLAQHMSSHDPKVDEAAYCAECNIQFRTMVQYRCHLHKTLKHARVDDMRFQCDMCGKAYLQKTNLIVHIEGVHGTERKYPCEICGKKFKTRPHRNLHARMVHGGTPARHVCDYCGRAFKAKRFLDEHINTHTGARPFKCSLCDATFCYKSALYLHGRFKHKIEKKTQKIEENTCTEPAKTNIGT